MEKSDKSLSLSAQKCDSLMDNSMLTIDPADAVVDHYSPSFSTINGSKYWMRYRSCYDYLRASAEKQHSS